jgi:hypothetical protein
VRVGFELTKRLNVKTIVTFLCAVVLLSAASASAIMLPADIQRTIEQPSLLISSNGNAAAIVLPVSSAVQSRNSGVDRTTTLHQQFLNASDEYVTASYAVPLRRGARISNLQITAVSMTIEGQVTAATTEATVFTSQSLQLSPKRRIDVVVTIVEPVVAESLETPATEAAPYATTTLPEDSMASTEDTLVVRGDEVDWRDEAASIQTPEAVAVDVIPPKHGRAPLAVSVGMMAFMLGSALLALRGVGVV